MLKLNKLSAVTGAAFTIGTMGTTDAFAGGFTAGAGGTVGANKSTFNDIGGSIVQNIATLPGLLTALSYMMGLMFSVLGILKIKDHVENPTQTQLKDGAIRLAVGGGLFLLPVVTGAMQNLVGTDSTAVNAAAVNKIDYSVAN